MSFGCSLSDIITSCKLAHDIYDRCFTKAQAADVKYFRFGREIQLLGKNLERLEKIVRNAEYQREDACVDVTAGPVNSLPEVIGDFRQTLKDCEKLLSDHTRFRRSPANFVDNVAWHSSTERAVNSLRQRVQFHMLKISFILKPLEVHLLSNIRHELQLIKKDVAALRAIFDWDTAQIGHPANTRAQDTKFVVPVELGDHFASAAAVLNKASYFPQDGFPIKEGFGAAVVHFSRSTRGVMPSPGLAQDLSEEERYLNLIKTKWIVDRLKENALLQSHGLESSWSNYVTELEQEVHNELCRLNESNFRAPSLESIIRLPDSCFSIWIDEEANLRRVALTDHRPSEEKILELPLEDPYTNDKATLMVFRNTETSFRLVTAFKDDKMDFSNCQESVDVNTNITRLIPRFAAPTATTTTTNNNILICSNSRDAKWYSLRNIDHLAQIQRALTGYRVSHDVSTVSWHIEFNKFCKPGISGKARVQLWQLKPLPKISPPLSPGSISEVDSSSSSSLNPYASLGDLNLRRFWTSGTLQPSATNVASPITSTRGNGVALKHPEPPALLMFTQFEGKHTFLHVQLHQNIFLEQQSCSNCRAVKTPCSRLLLRSHSRKFTIRRLRAEHDLYEWDLTCFRYPQHPRFEKLELLPSVKFLSLHFETLDASETFQTEFRSLEMVRNVDLNEYERMILETKHQSNNMKRTSP